MESVHSPYDWGQLFFSYIVAVLAIALGIFAALGFTLTGLYLTKRVERQKKDRTDYEHTYKSLFDNHRDGIITVDLHLRILEVNPAACRIAGLTGWSFSQRPCSPLIDLVPEEEKGCEEDLRGLLGQVKKPSYETKVRRPSGEFIHLQVTNVPLAVEGRLCGYYLILRDISEDKKAREHIQHLAFHDELTGLPNRRKFNLALEQTLDEAREQGKVFAVMMMDFDRFKHINDSLGHTYGDIFLKEMSERISCSVQGLDVVLARMGGDEFTLLFPCDREEDASGLAEQLIADLQMPYRLKEKDYFVTASIGIACYPAHGQNTDQLLSNADSAMYRVKKKGKNGFQFYSKPHWSRDTKGWTSRRA
ncbi:sensor domain-containing diguanylate cyclase [Paenibacillus puerhi]|uniref:sensor domain-containing diguanylate cyclase n=1 Tax=Paenibacillus puerhi TaxID=2692622 RepID=UPI00135A87E3|nr:sensor domain-containing diguanylate cyclase [Paenibacillus puerhi]